MTAASACPVALSPICAIGSGVGSVVGGATGSIAGDVLNAIVGWIVGGATWLLQHIGAVISSTTSVHVRAPWFESHYAVMASVAAVVALPLLLLAAVQAVFQQNPALLVRAAFVQLPLAGLLTGVAVQLVQLSLTATDELCTMVSAGSGGDIASALGRVATALKAMGVGPTPGFVVTVGGLLIVAGGLLLWLELIVRAAAVYVAVLFLPLALASLVWPAVSHWCRRLVDTIAALVLSKFVVVAVLSLAAGALGQGKGFDAVLAGGALLLLAAFTPFTLLRLLPMLEVGAALQVEGARHRVARAATSMPASAASYALGMAKRSMVPGTEPGLVGSGTDLDPGVPGADDEAAWDGQGSDGADPRPGRDAGTPAEAAALASLPPELRGDTLVPPPGGIPLWRGDPVATKEALEWLASYGTPVPDGAGGGALPGVEMPLYGGNEPPSRFLPGPTDHWPGWTPGGDVAGASSPGGPPFAGVGPAETEELWSASAEEDPDVPSEYFFD